MYTWISGTPGYQVRLDIRYAWISGTPGYQVRLDFMYTWISGTPGYPEHLDIMYTWISRIRMDISYVWISGTPEYQVRLDIRYPGFFFLFYPVTSLGRCLWRQSLWVSSTAAGAWSTACWSSKGRRIARKKRGGGKCLGKNSSVGDLRQFDADLDFNFHIDADLDLDWIRILLN